MAGQQARQEPQTIHAGGEWRAAVSGATREILDPADARPFAVVAEGDEKDTDLAVAAARQAFDSGQGPWPLTPSPHAPHFCAASPIFSYATAKSSACWRAVTRARPWRRAGSTSTVSPTPSATSPTWSRARRPAGSSTPARPTSTASSSTNPSACAR